MLVPTGPAAVPDEFNSEGKTFQESITPQLEYLVQSAGAALEMLGQYIAMFNDATFAYAQADVDSMFPKAPHLLFPVIPADTTTVDASSTIPYRRAAAPPAGPQGSGTTTSNADQLRTSLLPASNPTPNS